MSWEKNFKEKTYIAVQLLFYDPFWFLKYKNFSFSIQSKVMNPKMPLHCDIHTFNDAIEIWNGNNLKLCLLSFDYEINTRCQFHLLGCCFHMLNPLISNYQSILHWFQLYFLWSRVGQFVWEKILHLRVCLYFFLEGGTPGRKSSEKFFVCPNEN